MKIEKIQVVDDDPVIRILVAEYLTALGYTVDCAESGPLFLQRISVSPPDLAIVDLMMPEMNGFQVIQEIRQRPELAHLPVILLSAKENTSADAAQYGVMADAYVEKPFKVQDILQTIDMMKNRPPL